jgi:hypothetical protein
MFAVVTFAIAGPVCAGNGRGAGRAISARSAGRVAGARANMSRKANFRTNNRRFFSQNFSAFPSYGYGYGNQVYLNPDEADWSEQWTSLREENDGPYARSTWENPQGQARMWVFPEDGSTKEPSH